MRRAAFFTLSLGMAAVFFSAAPPAFPQASDSAHRTTYYLHGRIYTNDPKMPWASALAVRDDKIFCIGSIEHIMLDCGGSNSGGESLQKGGRFLMPGCHDSNMPSGSGGRDDLA